MVEANRERPKCKAITLRVHRPIGVVYIEQKRQKNKTKQRTDGTPSLADSGSAGLFFFLSSGYLSSEELLHKRV
jgi:hypothetical protein